MAAVGLAVHDGVLGFLWPGPTFAITPLRPFAGLPFALAVHSPWPRMVLQLFYGAGWLATGLLAARWARLVLPHAPLASFLAGALVLVACGNHMVNNLGYLTAWLAATALMLALVEATAFVLAGRRRSLVAALVSLAFSPTWPDDGMLAARPGGTPSRSGRCRSTGRRRPRWLAGAGR